jgi:AraC-like DNA-binding protein
MIDPPQIPGAAFHAITSGTAWLRVGDREPALARVLGVLHERPAEPWTVESLAQEVHISRATLARRFAES